jgi:hypothetical protein
MLKPSRRFKKNVKVAAEGKVVDAENDGDQGSAIDSPKHICRIAGKIACECNVALSDVRGELRTYLAARLPVNR